MGGCSSRDEDVVPPRSSGGFDENDSQRNRRRRERSNHGGGQSDPSGLLSLVRVGSRVLKPRKSRSGRTQLAAARASTYDHVHNVVLTNFEGQDVLKRRSGLVGLVNLGNTCFLNSSLQCLSNTIPLTDYFLGYDYRKEINYSNFLGSKGEMVTAYAALVKSLWLDNKRTIDPTIFKSSLDKFAPQFRGNDQHDSQELLSFLLDGIHEDLNRVKDRPYIEDKDCDGTNDEGDSIIAWESYLKRNRSVVVDLFQGQLRSTIKCCNARKKNMDGSFGCGHKAVKFEAFMYLSLPIPELSAHNCTLESCLDLFCSTEELVGDNKWHCPKCATLVDATKKFDIWTLPPILIVHLKRFRYDAWGSRSKIDLPVHYPLENWDLSNSLKSNHEKVPTYDLYAVSNHIGGLGGGHYTAFSKNRFDNRFYDFNDSTCRPLDSKADLGHNSAAYCLFYNRVERDQNPSCPSRLPVVRRQSTDRPELWPHMQLTARQECRDFSRSTVATTGVASQAGELTSGTLSPVEEESPLDNCHNGS